MAVSRGRISKNNNFQIIACANFTQISFDSKGAGERILAQAINTRVGHLSQDQLEFPFIHFVQAKRNRRDASSSVEEDNEKNVHENNDMTQYSENQTGDANEGEKNEARQKQRVCKGLPLCGRKNGDRRRQKRLTENITNYNLKRGMDVLMNLERRRHKQQVDTYIRSLVDLKGIKGKNQLNEEVKPSQANCLGWFRRQGSSSTTSSSVDAAGAAGADGGDADTGGDSGDADSNLQTSRRLRARRRTTTRRTRHN